MDEKLEESLKRIEARLKDIHEAQAYTNKLISLVVGIEKLDEEAKKLQKPTRELLKNE